MAKLDQHGVPRVDDAVDLATVRDEAEEIAVPSFDYIGQPIDAIIDGITGHSHDDDPDSEDTRAQSTPHKEDRD